MSNDTNRGLKSEDSVNLVYLVPRRNAEATEVSNSAIVTPPMQQDMAFFNYWEDPPPYEEIAIVEEQPTDNCNGFRIEYLYSVPGAFKLIEIVLSFIGVTVSLVGHQPGIEFVVWVTISSFIITMLLFILVAFNICSKHLDHFALIELIYMLLYVLKYFIATIMAAVCISGSVAKVISCVICAVAFFIFLLDAIMAYQRFKADQLEQDRDRAAASGQSDG